MVANEYVFLSGRLLLIAEVRDAMHTSQEDHQVGAFPVFCAIKRKGVFLLHMDGILAHYGYTQH